MTKEQEIEHAFLIRDLAIAIDEMNGLASSQWTALFLLTRLAKAESPIPCLGNNSKVIRYLKRKFPELWVRITVYTSELPVK
jgi:hypothetical protein